MPSKTTPMGGRRGEAAARIIVITGRESPRPTPSLRPRASSPPRTTWPSYLARLSPNARSSSSVLFGRRANARNRAPDDWHDLQSSLERSYGLGTISGNLDGWIVRPLQRLARLHPRTLVVPEHDLQINIYSPNAIDVRRAFSVDDPIHILAAFSQAVALHARPGFGSALGGGSCEDRSISCPSATRVLSASTASSIPFCDTRELQLTRPDAGRIALYEGLFEASAAPVRRPRSIPGR